MLSNQIETIKHVFFFFLPVVNFGGLLLELLWGVSQYCSLKSVASWQKSSLAAFPMLGNSERGIVNNTCQDQWSTT